MKTTALLFIVPLAWATLCGFSCSALKAGDPCLRKIPPNLQKQLLTKFPDDRIPAMGDSRLEDIEQDLQHGGDGCFLVAVGDFDGNKQDDVALILFSKKNNRLRLVAALKESESWHIESLDSWDGRGDHPYIHTLPPGNYVRTKALESAAMEPGELPSFSSKLTGFVHGTIESSGCAYFRSNGTWAHVWISD